MSYNYNLPSFLGKHSLFDEVTRKRRLLQGFMLLMMVFSLSGLQAQTTLINPTTDGGFNSGNTFAANGWTVANEGVGAVKWVVGTAVNSGAISGNSAYVSLDNGETNSSAGISGARTIYFYKDIAIPAGQTNIALTFNWKAIGTAWQVFAAPTSVAPIGSDTQLSVPAIIAGATSITYNSAAGTGITQNAFAFIPPAFAGTTARLIFMWSNSSGGGSNPPAAIDNISVVSRAGGNEIASIATGNFTDPATWDFGYVPSAADDIVINTSTTVTIDARNLSANNLYIAGANAVLQFGTTSDEFTVYNDLLVSGSGAQFKVYEGTNGKSLKVGHDITLGSGGRLDVSVGSSGTGAGALNLFGSTLQTISSDGTGLVGGTVVATGSTNTAGVISQLLVTNTSSAIPNIEWQLDNVRIKNVLRLTSGRIMLGSNKIILGNYSALFSSSFTCNLGSGFIGGTISRWYGTSSTGVAMDPGVDYNPSTAALFPSLSATGKNRWAFIYATNTSTAGELALNYTDAASISTALSIADGSYTITDRYDGSWLVSTSGSTYASAAGTFSLGLYATGAYATNDGSSRIVNAATAASGNHINGTTTPFVARSGMTLANLTAGAFYVGSNSTSLQAPTTKISVATGDWNVATTWSPSGVPICSDVVIIASGNTVTVNGTANAAGITINGTLVNAGGTMTVGCTNNNAVFTNNGTHTVSGGILVVNGGVYQKYGSTFNQSGGDIIVDSNAAGDAVNSVGQGGSSFKIDTSNLSLTGGKITIVDPLVNNTVATTATSGTDYTLTTLTLGTAGTFTQSVSGNYAIGATSMNVPSFNSNLNMFGVGQQVSGPGIQPGTTITGVTALINITITLSLPINAAISSPTLTFTSMANGQYNIAFPNTGNWSNVAIGQLVTGPGIQPGTTVVGAGSGIDGKGGIQLSLPVSGLATSPITSDQAITLSAASSGCASIILSAANPAILVGQTVAGIGVQPATTVTAINGIKMDLSLPLAGTVTNPLALSFYDGNLNSFAFAYNSPVNYAAGLNHTLQIGDALSTDKAAVTTNGYLCNMVQGGGVLSLGNLTIDAVDGTNRFMNTVNALNVQNAFTVTVGSIFKKSNSTGGIYFGGNITNNGIVHVANFTSINFANYINSLAVPTTLPQTISGAGTFYNNMASGLSTGSFGSIIFNNTSSQGITISTPNFRAASGVTMTAGIIHTSAATPLYLGLTDLSSGGVITGNFSDTCFIDGPFSKVFATNQTSANYQTLPVGKGTSYMPVSLAVSGGASFTAEAFTTNAGTASANIANVSPTRWKVTRDGVAGAFTDFNVKVGQSAITANNILVQATTDQGVYDSVLGTAATFTAGTPNTINTIAALPGASFTGNFAYATAPDCTVVNPGNTIADLTISRIITSQNTTNSGMVSGSSTVTLTAANALITTGLTITGNGIPAGTTVAAISGVTLTLSQAATVTVASQTVLTFTAVETPTTLCGTQPVRLSLQNAVLGNGIVYQWQNSANGTTYADILGATAASYTATPLDTTYYQCVITCPNGPVTATSTPVQVTFSNTAPSVTPVTICAPGVANLEAAAATGTVTWYDVAIGGTPLATGTTFAPTIAATTIYYVSAETSSTYTTGKSLTGTTTQTIPFSGLIFNASTNVRLNSVKIYPKQTLGAVDAGAPMTIKLFKDGVQVPGTSAVTFIPSTNTGAVTASVSNVVTLDYNIPAGTGYKLLITNGLTSTNAVAKISAFPALPYGLGAISVTAGASSFDGSPDLNSYNNFFDLNVTEVCASSRVPVVATVGCAPVQDCATIGTAVTTAVTCFGDATGTAVITMSALTPSLDAISYTVDSGSPQNTTLVSGAFTVTGLNVGNHTVIVTNAGCPDVTVTFAIAGPTTPLTNTTTESVCGSYTWSVTGLNYTSGGIYTGTTTNVDGCTVNETLNLTVTPNTTNTTAIIACDTYTWAVNGTTYTASGSYDLVVGCHTETLALTINSAATPTGSSTQTIAVTDLNNATLANLVVSPTNVIWYSTLLDVQSETNPLDITTVLTNGLTYYAVNVSSGCPSTPFAVTVTVELGVDGFHNESFKFYPNPTSGILTLSYSTGIANVTVLNLIGQVVLEAKPNLNEVQIDLSSLPSSTYFVKVITVDGNSKAIKVVKRN
jgi:hypothetical protein